MNKSPIPVHLNQPILILAWESDTFILGYMLSICSFAIGSWFLVISIGTAWAYARAKAKYNRGFMVHGPYMVGLYRFEGYPTNFQNHFFG